MSYQYIWLLLLPIAALSGWLTARLSYKKKYMHQNVQHMLPKDYMTGLNYLLNDEEDKALDVFVKMLDVDHDTIETHMALGNLFSRRGELQRAIRVHQNLIARPGLKKEYKQQALFALATDYLKAGVLDRAEKIFLELLRVGTYKDQSLKHLVDIYQCGREWHKAIEFALQAKNKFSLEIAYYYCELARQHIKNNEDEQAIKKLKKSLSYSKQCARAYLLLASIAYNQKKYKQSVKYLSYVKEYAPEYVAEMIIPLGKALHELNKKTDFYNYCAKLIQEFKLPYLLTMCVEEIKKYFGAHEAASFLTKYVTSYPSLGGIHQLTGMQLSSSADTDRQNIQVLHNLTQELLVDKKLYQCVHCGFSANTMHWMCPSCRVWGSIKRLLES
jgi:lipopolysaccharide assembly protein B